MKKNILLFSILTSIILLSSCKVNTYYNEARYGRLVLDTVSSADIQIVGVCTAEATIKKIGAKLDPAYSKQYKQGEFDDFLSVAAAPTELKGNFLTELMKAISNAKSGLAKGVVKDPGRDFVMFALYEKYPDVDYFSGVTINRVSTVNGKFKDETLKVKAIGIKLKTDK